MMTHTNEHTPSPSAPPHTGGAMSCAQDRCDVFVVGGGPAGSTAAALLAGHGWRVVLADKDRHPRFHIGESLLPANLPLFERLGVLDQVRAIGVRKEGADFSSPTHPNGMRSAYFADAFDPQYDHAFQVRRSDFDHLLLTNASRFGAEVHEGTKVTSVERHDAQDNLVSGAVVHTVNEDGEGRAWRCRFVVDASGRDALMASASGQRKKDPRHESAAVYAHFEGVPARAGRDAGNVSLYWFEHGWIWMIPLPGGVTSVGAVCWPQYLKTRKSDLDEFLLETIALCPPAVGRMHDARAVTQAEATGNYSYRASKMHADHYVLVGDAFGFIDPIFSSGVFLAMNSASLAADAVDANLRGAPDAQRRMRRFERDVRRGLAMFSWFIYRFTTPALHNLFMAPRNLLGVRRAVTSVVAGDVFRACKTDLPLALFKGVYYATVAGAAVLNRFRSRRTPDQTNGDQHEGSSTSRSPRATTT